MCIVSRRRRRELEGSTKKAAFDAKSLRVFSLPSFAPLLPLLTFLHDVFGSEEKETNERNHKMLL